MNEETKTCPFCAETIKSAAIVCRYCNRDLPAAPPVIQTAFPNHIINPYNVPPGAEARPSPASASDRPDIPPLTPEPYQPQPPASVGTLDKPLSASQFIIGLLIAVVVIGGAWSAMLAPKNPDPPADSSPPAVVAVAPTPSPAEKKKAAAAAALAAKQEAERAREEKREAAREAKAEAEALRKEQAYEATIAMRGDDVALKRGWDMHYGEYDNVYITGTVINESNHALRYAEVKFAIVDKAGNTLETPMDNISYIPPRGSWKFKVNVMTESDYRYGPVSVESMRADGTISGSPDAPVSDDELGD